ncbi:MAG: barstar family protein [Zoogloeaceae bacterium]|jgi:RNAse (barnase) inhibitor barstar|nr:barstar family protein [Zoogloeaceae bacterium]
MATYSVDGKALTDWDAFHTIFAETFNFPSYYGRNRNAWIDCMGDVSEMDGSNSITTLLVHNAKSLKANNPEIYDAIVECSAFVNYRYVSEGDPPVLVLAFWLNEVSEYDAPKRAG